MNETTSGGIRILRFLAPAGPAGGFWLTVGGNAINFKKLTASHRPRQHEVCNRGAHQQDDENSEPRQEMHISTKTRHLEPHPAQRAHYSGAASAPRQRPQDLQCAQVAETQTENRKQSEKIEIRRRHSGDGGSSIAK